MPLSLNLARKIIRVQFAIILLIAILAILLAKLLIDARSKIPLEIKLNDPIAQGEADAFVNSYHNRTQTTTIPMIRQLAKTDLLMYDSDSAKSYFNYKFEESYKNLGIKLGANQRWEAAFYPMMRRARNGNDSLCVCVMPCIVETMQDGRDTIYDYFNPVIRKSIYQGREIQIFDFGHLEP